MVTRKWKLNGDQLFDMEKDNSETTDVAAQHQNVVLKMKVALANYKKMEIPSQFKLRPADWRQESWQIQDASKSVSNKK